MQTILYHNYIYFYQYVTSTSNSILIFFIFFAFFKNQADKYKKPFGVKGFQVSALLVFLFYLLIGCNDNEIFLRYGYQKLHPGTVAGLF